MKRTDYLPYLAGTLMALIFGFSYLFIEAGLAVFEPFELLCYRFTLAAAVITALAAFRIIKINLKGKPVHMLIFLSFFQPLCYFVCETMAVKYASVSETGIFIAFIPVFVTILAYLILKEKPYSKQIVFILISVSGAVFDVIMSGSFEYRGNMFGMLCLIGIVLSSGGYNIMSRKSSKIFSPIEITFVMMWSAAIFYNAINLVEILVRGRDGSLALLFSFHGVIPILYLGVLSSIGGFFLLNYILSKLSVASASVFSQLCSIVAILSGVTIGGETLHWYQVASGILILAGVFGTNYYENKMKGEVI